jgi:hypothetical protein
VSQNWTKSREVVKELGGCTPLSLVTSSLFSFSFLPDKRRIARSLYDPNILE